MSRLIAPDALNAIGAAAREALTARLDGPAAAPLAAAFSGGGDSLALLIIAKAWADAAGRRLIALTVDHGLNPDSGRWARWCAERAERLGVAHRTLVWEGPKPVTGIAHLARRARHALIAEAARMAGAHVVLFGHTADDVLESDAMRAAGLAISAPKAWSPSPAWPQGRGLFIARPLLRARRAALREALAAAGESWIDDPANADLAQPRARARSLIAGGGLAGAPRAESDPAPLFDAVAFGPAGNMAITLGAFGGRDALAQSRFLGMALACVGGGGGPARGPAFHRLPRLIARGERFAATLGGVRLASDGAVLRLVREGGDRRARPAPCLTLTPGETTVFDGRFEATARTGGLTLRHLTGLAARLAPADHARLAPLDPAARRVLPAVIDAEGRATCPTLVADARVAVRNLTPARLAGACGRIAREARIGDYDGFAL